MDSSQTPQTPGGKRRFSFPAYGTLKKSLGRDDQAVECIELAMRDLLFRCETDADLEKVAQLHEIRLNGIGRDGVGLRSVQLYIVSVHRNVERFVYDIKRDHRVFYEPWCPKGNESLLEWCVTNVASDDLASSEFRACEYYRLVRNQAVHPKIQKNIGDTVTALRTSMATDAEYKKLDAPNLPHSLTFDDFVLFTRAAKKLASRLCQAAAPSDERLIGWAHNQMQRGMSPGRTQNFLATKLRTVYSLGQEHALALAAAAFESNAT